MAIINKTHSCNQTFQSHKIHSLQIKIGPCILWRPSNNFRPPKGPSNNHPQCHICSKFGHIAYICHNRHNPLYPLPLQNPPQAYFNPFSPTSVSSPPNQLTPNPLSHPDDVWFMDSGATHHMTLDFSQLQQSGPYLGNGQVIIDNGKSLLVKHVGSSCLSHSIKLNFILHDCTLLSVNHKCIGQVII